MKVILSVFGRFHIFNTAEELSKFDALYQFYTTYPKYFIKRWNINSTKYNTYPFLEILNRIRSKFFRNIFNDSIFLKKIYDKLISITLSKDADIYISWGGYAYDSMLKAKKNDIKIILEIGSSHPFYAKNILEKEFKEYGSKVTIDSKKNINWQLKTIEMADYISIPSSFVKRTFIEYGVPEEKLLVNPYGVDLSKFRQVDKQDNVFRIIFCGLLSLQKGSHYLLEAFYNLNLENCELWHIGNILPEMHPFIEKYKSDKIIFKGSYPQNELYKLYSQGSVFVMPSIQEGLALVQLQAMACGLPLICTTNTGGDDLITQDGEEGFVIPIRDVEAIEEKITYMYNNQDICYEMGQKAKKRVSNGFTWSDYGRRYINNLEKILDDKNK
jgi:glycosyltransferase involved in cell wall biosynthesis